MKIRDKKPTAAEDEKATITPVSRNTISRREFLAGSAAVGVTILLPGGLFAARDGKKTFTILHTNDMHASFIGMGPASDYTPFTLNDDTTRGGYARLAGLIAKRKDGAQESGSGAGARRGRLQHGDGVQRRDARDRRRTAPHGQDGV